MRSRPLIVISLVIICLLALIAIVALSRLPAGSQLPVHWNAAGEADGFADAGYALFMPVVLSAGLSALFAILPRIEPLQDRMSGSAALLDACWTGLLALMLLVQLTVAAPAFGLVLPSTLILAGLGILLITIGNALPKSRPGFFVGIRTPWALIDTDNWIATHRLDSQCFQSRHRHAQWPYALRSPSWSVRPSSIPGGSGVGTAPRPDLLFPWRHDMLSAALAMMLALGTPTQVSGDIEAPGPNGPLRGTMVLPAKDAPIILMIPGSGPTDRDGNSPLGCAPRRTGCWPKGWQDKGSAAYGSTSAACSAARVP